MTKGFHGVPASLGLTQEEFAKYCETLRAARLSRFTLSNRDVAWALQELSASTPNLAETVRTIAAAGTEAVAFTQHARQITTLLRGRDHARPSSIDTLRRLGKPQLSYGRCGCGRPSIPGESTCYTCSS